ncbi:hypothetical protein GCM10020331_005520 [Ectobacillus funiculus]
MIHFVKRSIKLRWKQIFVNIVLPVVDQKHGKKLYNQRSAVERVNAYLKRVLSVEKNVRYRTGKRAKVHFDLVTLVYNASKISSRPHETTTT